MNAPQAVRHVTMQREPAWLIGYGLAMMCAGSLAGVAMTLFAVGLM